MSDPKSAPVSVPVGATPTFTRDAASPATLAEITAANEAAAVTSIRQSEAASLKRVTGLAASGSALVIAAGLFLAPQADARVVHTPAPTAQPGPVVVTDGRVICEGRYHVTVPVKTTGVAADGRHYAAVWLQEHRTGRARLVGWARSFNATVNVVGCIDPASIDGHHGPVYVIKQDAVDGRTRPVRVLFDAGSREGRVAK